MRLLFAGFGTVAQGLSELLIEKKDELKERHGIDWKVTGISDMTPGVRIRLALTELGPTFIKLGQILSLRKDLLPDIVTDEDVNVRDWNDVIWAMTTRMDPVRDTTLVENTPIDYLDFASPVSGLGGKIGFDATNKWPGETQREWGRPITMDAAVKARIDAIWQDLGID